jgi:hypothetical protein
MARRPQRARVAGLAVLAAAGLLLSGCAADDSPGAAATTSAGASSSSSTSPTTEPVGPESTPTTVAPPLPQPVGSVPKVKRQGQTGTPTVTAPGAAFTKPVRYPDGVQLAIVRAEKAVETGHGPGVMAGRDYVRFEVRLTNGSAKAIRLDQVVVTTFYGTSRQLAAPVYTESAGTADFFGTVKPGASTTARYAFAVPAKELGRVTMVVDFDGVHTSATYSGAVVTS